VSAHHSLSRFIAPTDWITDWLTCLQHHRVIAVIRASDLATGLNMAQAAADAGINLIEITWNSAEPGTLLKKLRRTLPNCRIGVGTILTPDDLSMAIASGAQYCFSPYTSRELIELAYDYEVPLIPGAMTPTEIVSAWQAGASSVKVFPIDAIGGPNYVKNLQGPLGQIPLIPTGGVSLGAAPELIRAGALAVGISGSLFKNADVIEQNWQAICDRAYQLRIACQNVTNHYTLPAPSPAPLPVTCLTS
jgi:2-dehydro-3-deoxyphosphogluconate aldolase / (4S)-4-hydroxy-2-oxoglutarate aldolase